MKKLTQDVFIGQSEHIKSAAVDKDGDAWFYQVSSDRLTLSLVDGKHWDCSIYAVTFVGSEYDTSDWENSAIDREVDNKNQPQEPYFLMKGDLFYRHSYRGYSNFSAWAGVYDKDEAIAYAEKSGGSVIAKPARNFYHEPEEIDRMIERLQLIRRALRDSPNGY